MDRKPQHTFLADLWSWTLAMAVTVGAVGCMSSGLFLEPESWAGLLLAWGLTALLCCLCARIRRGALILLIVLVSGAVFFGLEGTLTEHLETLIYRISVIYDKAYDCGVVSFGGEPSDFAPLDMGLGLIGCLCAATCAACLCANTIALPCILAGFFPLATCMVVNDTPPAEGWLFLLLTALLLIALTSTVRRRSREDGLRLGALLLIPVILVVSLTFRIAPSSAFRDGFVRFQDAILAWVQTLTLPSVNGPIELPYGDPSYIDTTDLTTLGPQVRRYYPVMDIAADYTGIVYLRGQSYDDYDGKNWAASYAASYANLDWPSAESRREIGSITIKTRETLPLRYFPYYPAGLWWFSEFGRGYMTNIDELTEYTFKVSELIDGFYDGKQEGTSGSSSLIYSPESSEIVNLQLPNTTRAAALSYLRRYDLSQAASRSEKAQAICQLVSESATYSLNTPKMPADEEDFAIWFLERSDTGYCVHYATAAVVLLRASGIPARYVTGYARKVNAGQTVTVNAHHAHAWVEYYDDVARCWRPLDPTPVSFDSTNPGTSYGTEDPQPTNPSVETTPPVPSTEPSTAPPLIWATEWTDPSEPQQTETSDQPMQAPGPRDFPWAVPLGVLAALALITGQYFLRRLLRKKRFAAGAPNARALARWHQVDRYALALKRKPPAELRELAEKARFSQHSLTDEELAQFDSYLARAREDLKEQSLPARIFWRLLLAIE